MDEVTKRINRVAESILENERLTSDLDDASAKVLLTWVLACGKTIAQDTAGLDDDAAEKAMYPRLKAMRRMMRSINKWIIKLPDADHESSLNLLAKIIDRAAGIYGQDFTPPTLEKQNTFLQEQAEYTGNSPQLIENLRNLIEDPDNYKPIWEKKNG